MDQSYKNKVITLAHGSGGLLTSRLIKEYLLKYFHDPVLKRLEDSAEIITPGTKVAFTVDSYVVNPIFFPGGDIGKLAICGTVNDLAMKGAVPRFIAFSLIIEEGFSFNDFDKILKSASQTAKKAGVRIVCGDTKVVDKGNADKIFITTAGIGSIKIDLSKEKIRVGDKIIVSGSIGDHGIAVMNERLNLGLKSRLRSDVAPLNLITNRLFMKGFDLHFMRDPTRGGIVSVLNEAIAGTKLGIMLQESSLPINKEVIGVSEILGLDPLYIANEGKFIAVVARKSAKPVLRFIKSHILGKGAAIIGEIVPEPKGVWLNTKIGGTRPLLQLEAEGLPRIC